MSNGDEIIFCGSSCWLQSRAITVMKPSHFSHVLHAAPGCRNLRQINGMQFHEMEIFALRKLKYIEGVEMDSDGNPQPENFLE